MAQFYQGLLSSDDGEFNTSWETFFVNAELVAQLVKEGRGVVLQVLQRGGLWQGTSWGITRASRKVYQSSRPTCFPVFHRVGGAS